MNTKDFLGLIRAWSLPMTIVSLFLGLAYAYYLGLVTSFYNVIYWLIAALGALLLHMSVNVLNDYYDTLNGIDRADSPTTKYRVHPILSGAVTPRFARDFGFSLMVAGVVLGIYVAFLEMNIWIGIIGSIGVFLLYAYTGNPFTLKYRGIGELIVSLVYGPLLVGGGFITASIKPPSASMVLISMPLFLIMFAIIYSNYYRDRDYDAKAGIKTIAMKTAKYGYGIYTSSILLAFLIIITAVVMDVLPITTLITLASVPLVPNLIKSFRVVANDIDARTGRLFILFSILYAVGLIIGRLV